MAEKNDPAVLSYCAGAMLPHLKTLQSTAEKINNRSNIEDIHDIRVASRRVRTCMTIFKNSFPSKKYRNWVKDIKSITNSYGAVRDLDVQIELLNNVLGGNIDKKILPGLRRVRLRLKQRREKIQSETSDITKAVINSSTLSEMQVWCEKNISQELIKSPALFQQGYLNIQSHLDEFLFFEVYMFDPDRVRELHQMRIAAKKLRYSLEVFSDLFNHETDFALEIARQSQEILGQIHDADVWISYLPNFIDREQNRISAFYGYSSPFSRLHPGIDFLINNRNQERRKLYKKYLDQWRKWKLKESWLNLRKVIFLTSIEEYENQETSTSQSNNSNQENNTDIPRSQDTNIQ